MPLMTPDEETAFVERIAEAVLRRIDEREKIALLADAVVERLGELGSRPSEPIGRLRGTADSSEKRRKEQASG